MTEAIIVQVITTGGVIAVALMQVLGNRKLKRIGKDAAVARKQTENEHTEAEYPNLRDEMTAIRTSIDRGFERTERYIKDVDTDARSTRHALDRHIESADRKLDAISQSVPELIATATAQHVADCPLRQN